MAAQLEDGFTRTANEIIDALMKVRLNGTQHNLIHCIIRHTYGFQRKSHAMSLSYMSNATDIHKDLVKRELDKLIQYKVVRVFKDADFRNSREVGMNKNIDEWQVPSKSISRQSAKQSTVIETVGEQSPNQSTPTVDQLVYQERKSFKESKDTTTTADVHTKVFGTLMMRGQMSDYVMKLKDQGFTDAFIQELMLETGEAGNNPSLRLMQTIGERWIRDGIYTRAESKRRKEESKGGYPRGHKEEVAKRELSGEEWAKAAGLGVRGI